METELVIHQGMTIEGKPLKDHFEAVNHRDAIQYIRAIVQKEIEFDSQVLFEIHALILQGIDRTHGGIYRRDNVRIGGSRHVCPNYRKVPDLMDEYFRFYQEHKDTLHPVDLAAEMHEKLVTIHPFLDGNSRTARLVMNVILLQHGYPITVITSDKKNRTHYYNALETANLSMPPDKSLFKCLVTKYVKEWALKYLEFLAPSLSEASQGKGYYFFKTIQPYLHP